jgi:SAM-dependent methyltransferase
VSRRSPSDDGLNVSDRWRGWRARVDLDEYETRWDRLAEAGGDVHGEADAVDRLGAGRVLDAGCGMGRVAVELARRGRHVVGVDNDAEMLERARRRDPSIAWVLGDLATVRLDDSFDLVLLAGNVLIFVEPGEEEAVVANLAGHLDPGGLFVAGYSLRGVTVEDHDRWCEAAGLTYVDRWSTWEGAAYDGGDYAVSLHRRRPAP